MAAQGTTGAPAPSQGLVALKGAAIGGAAATGVALGLGGFRDDALLLGLLGGAAGAVTGALLPQPRLGNPDRYRGFQRGLLYGGLTGAVAMSVLEPMLSSDRGFTTELVLIGSAWGAGAGAVAGAILGAAGPEEAEAALVDRTAALRLDLTAAPGGGMGLRGRLATPW